MKRYMQPLVAMHVQKRPDIAAGLNRRELKHSSSPAREPLCYYADVPIGLLQETNDLLDQIVHFAFDTLGAQQLQLRIRDAE